MGNEYCKHCGRGEKPKRWFVKGRYELFDDLGYLGNPHGTYGSWTGHPEGQQVSGGGFTTKAYAAEFLRAFIINVDGIRKYSDFNIVEETVNE
jgi:hypothetical protein